MLIYYRVNTNKKIKLVKFDSNNTETRAMMERCLSFKHYKAKWFVPHKLAESYEAFTRHKLKSSHVLQVLRSINIMLVVMMFQDIQEMLLCNQHFMLKNTIFPHSDIFKLIVGRKIFF